MSKRILGNSEQTFTKLLQDMGSKSQVFNLEHIQRGNCTCQSQIILMHALTPEAKIKI